METENVDLQQNDLNKPSSPRKSSADSTTEVKPLTKRKKKVKREIEPYDSPLNGTLNSTLNETYPWSGRLEPMEYLEPYPGPYKTSLFWVRRGREMEPVLGTDVRNWTGHHQQGLPGQGPEGRVASVGVANAGMSRSTEMYQGGGNHGGPSSSRGHPLGNMSTSAGGYVGGVSLPMGGVNGQMSHVEPNVYESVDSMNHINSTRHAAPWKQHKPNIDVFLRITFRKVGQIDTVTETFNADLIIQARWHYDDKRDDPISNNSGHIKPWRPMLYVENTDKDVIKVVHRELWVDPEGEVFVIERMTARGVFSETMELDHFPFDCQKLTVTLASGHHSGEITLKPDPLDPSFLYQGNFVDKQEWHLYEYVEVSKPEVDECEGDTQVPLRPALSFTCQSARRIGFFTWNVFLILTVIFLMHMCSFAVEKSDTNPRLSLSITTFITALLFKVTLNRYLPRISYLTYMDSYILLQLVLMAFICGWHATVNHLPTADNVADRTELIMLVIISIIYVLFQIIFGLVVYFIPGRRRRELRQNLLSRQHEFKMRKPMSSYA